jgi:glycosyltransferase involved in cell wall biosynthesis
MPTIIGRQCKRAERIHSPLMEEGLRTPARIALVHDFLLDLRGAERVFAAICDIWPRADVYTAVYDERGTEGRFADREVRTSFLQRLRPTARTFRSLLPLYPYAIESFDLSGYDLVVSSSSAWAHGVIVDERAIHLCYCYNPFRYAWNERESTLAARGPLARMGLRWVFNRWRQWDWIAAQRVDRYVAISDLTKRRIQRYYGREASVLHPPVETGRFSPGDVGDYYLVVSELMFHKRIEVAVEAFNRLRLPLVIVGDGPEGRRLRRAAGPTIRFEGRVSDARVAGLMQGARALVVTAAEEFGIAAVEAQAAGRPVIALAEGGARETVVEGETGSFFERPTPDALAAAVASFDPLAVDPAACVAQAERFDHDHFRSGLERTVAESLAEPREPRRPPRRPRRVPTRLLAPV